MLLFFFFVFFKLPELSQVMFAKGEILRLSLAFRCGGLFFIFKNIIILSAKVLIRSSLSAKKQSAFSFAKLASERVPQLLYGEGFEGS